MEERDYGHLKNDYRDLHDRSAAGPSGVTTSPTHSNLAQRRRSSAAHTRPSLPAPNLPIPNVPKYTNGHSNAMQSNGSYQRDDYSTCDSPPQPSAYLNGNNHSARSELFTRQTASPALAAVAAFPTYSGTSYNALASATSSVDDLSDPPPPSMLPGPSSRAQTSDVLESSHLAPPSTEQRPPSSRRALTRALELARQAVQLDSSNDDPQAAVMAYGRSVALLSEVMERVRRGEDTTEPKRRNGRRRNSVAQEEEVRRLQRIHDTYADRMNILSIVYSIPPMPYTAASVYSAATSESAQSHSPASSVSGTSETSDSIPPPPYFRHMQDDSEDETYPQSSDGVEAIGAAMFTDLASPIRSEGRSEQSHLHPYANTQSGPPEPQVVPNTTSSSPVLTPAPYRASMHIRRSRASSAALPPALPPPANSPPPAPDVLNSMQGSLGSKQHVDVAVNRQGGDSIGHRRTGSGSKLAALEEEGERYGEYDEAEGYDAGSRMATMNMRGGESPPLPALPSPTHGSPNTPKNLRSSSSPRAHTATVHRPRGSSQASQHRPENVIINSSITQGTISQRRFKTSTPSTPRSSSPTGSVASVGSYPRSVASSLPASSASGSLSSATRSRSSSQPGRRPSVASGGHMSPTQELPPLPSSLANGVVAQRKVSNPIGLPPFPQPLQLNIQTDLTPNSASFTPLLNATPQIFSAALPVTPVSPLPPSGPVDPLRKPYHLMNLLRTTMTSATGGYITRKLHVPQEVWSQGGAKLSNTPEKVRVVGILCSALEDLQNSSSEQFGAGNVSSGMALGIGSIGRKEGEAWLSKLEDFSTVCDDVVANFGKKLGVGERFVLKKTTWGDKLGRRFDKYVSGKNLDSPAAYVQGLRRLFIHVQLLDEHTKAVSSTPVAPAYGAFPLDIRQAADLKLKRCSEFFATVVLTFVIRDLSQLLDKYAKKCEKWLAE